MIKYEHVPLNQLTVNDTTMYRVYVDKKTAGFIKSSHLNGVYYVSIGCEANDKTQYFNTAAEVKAEIERKAKCLD